MFGSLGGAPDVRDRDTLSVRNHPRSQAETTMELGQNGCHAEMILGPAGELWRYSAQGHE